MKPGFVLSASKLLVTGISSNPSQLQSSHQTYSYTTD